MPGLRGMQGTPSLNKLHEHPIMSSAIEGDVVHVAE